MGSGNNAVCVDPLGCAFDHCLEVVLEIDRLEVRIEFFGGDIAQVLGILWVVVAADAP